MAKSIEQRLAALERATKAAAEPEALFLFRHGSEAAKVLSERGLYAAIAHSLERTAERHCSE